MYGTVAKLMVKAGKIEELKNHMNIEYKNMPGALDILMYQTDEDVHTMYIAVVFSDKNSYIENSESPESNVQYEKLMEFLEAEPEWHDGQVIFNRRFT
ncbi:MAG TPA: hypothetical protein VMW28_00755 [Pelolinea sp.]|nr:hypothetical protein [Pelolinea sp.]